MITLKEHLIKQHVKSVKIDIILPKTKETVKGSNEYEVIGTRNIQVENKPIVIYKDKYHRNSLHIAAICDLCCSLGQLWYDFEDFTEKDIIAQFDTFQEAAKYALDDIEKYHHKYYDSDNWLKSAARGNENENDGYDEMPNKIDFYGEIIDNLSMWTTVEGWEKYAK